MKEHLLIFWQRKLEDSYRENYDLQAENARLKAQVDCLRKVMREASAYIVECRNLETPACCAYALLLQTAAKDSKQP